jgi:hypothetical protein
MSLAIRAKVLNGAVSAFHSVRLRWTTHKEQHNYLSEWRQSILSTRRTQPGGMLCEPRTLSSINAT